MLNVQIYLYLFIIDFEKNTVEIPKMSKVVRVRCCWPLSENSNTTIWHKEILHLSLYEGIAVQTG